MRKEYSDQIATVFEGPRGDYEEKQVWGGGMILREIVTLAWACFVDKANCNTCIAEEADCGGPAAHEP